MTATEHPLTPDHDVPAAEPGDASDSELIRLVRAGDAAAYEHLFLRHREVAIRYARRISDSERAEDLCAEAFTKILDLLQRGKGPDVAFRAYLLTTVRTSHLNNLRSGKREDLVPDYEPITRMLPSADDPDARFDAAAIYRAFDKLPERWRAALWLTSVEGLSNEEASRHLGVKVNAVASLAFRARAGLRQAYLSEHLLGATDPRCRRVVELLPSYLRDRLTARRREVVEAHLSTCAACTTVALELSEVNGRLGALLAPLALTGFAVIVPAKATSLTAVGLTALSGAGTSVVGAAKGVVASAVVQGKAGGAVLSGVVSTKLAVAATITAIGVAVGAQVVDHDSTPGSADTSRTEDVIGVDEVLPPAAVASASPTPSKTPPTRRRLTVPAVQSVPSPSRTPSAPTPTATPTPSATPSATPTPTPTPVVTPSTTATRTSVEQPSTQSYMQSGLRWEQVTVPVSTPPKNAFLTVTTTRTLSTALATTTGTGWICGTPVTDWFSGGFYATSTFSCMYSGNGDAGPLRFDYRVVTGSVLTAALTPPTGFRDTDLADNLRQLPLR